jgi:tetratricopeptide (TPR) repeat protein
LLGSIRSALALSCCVQSAAAQNQAELNALIFEPVLLSAELSKKSDPAVSNAAQPDASSTVDANADAKNPAAADLAANLRARAQNPQMLQAQIQRYRDSISSLSRSSASPYSEALREQDYSLALLLAQSGDYEAAIPVLEAAMHIDRVNLGLFTPRQVDLVNQLIQNHGKLGHYEQVADYEEYLYYIQTKSYPPDDPRRIAATERWADWNVESFLKTAPQDGFATSIGMSMGMTMGSPGGFGYVPVQSASGMVYYLPRDRLPYALNSIGMSGGALSDFSLRSSGYAVPPQMLVDERLTRAEGIYETLQNQGNLGPERNAELLRKQANISFAIKRQMEAMSSSINSSFGFNTFTPEPINPVVNRGYRDNMESLEALAQRIESDPDATPEAKARAYLDLGDWHLSFEHFKPASEAYHKAWELAGSPPSTALALHPVLRPDYVVPIPTFVQHPYSREFYGVAPTAQLDYKGHVDMEVEIDRRGHITHEKILATSEHISGELRNTLRNYLRDSRVRPYLHDGEVTDVTLNLRFYYTY